MPTMPLKISKHNTVRFAEDRNKTILITDNTNGFDEDSCANRRQRRRRQQETREEIEIAAERMRRTGYGILLRDSFGVGNKRFDAEDAATIQQNLNAFVQTDFSRGLERHVSEQHDDERTVAYDTAVRAVVLGQKILSKKGKTSDEIWERLGLALHTHSMNAAAFARRLGIADELAARDHPPRGDHCVEASDLVIEMNRGNARKVVRQPSFYYISDQSNSTATSCNSEMDDSDMSSPTHRRATSMPCPRCVRDKKATKPERCPEGIHSGDCDSIKDPFSGSLHKPEAARTA